MKILMRQFFGKNHSWSTTGQGIARGLIAHGHEVDIFSTNGISHFPEDLKPNLVGYVEENTAKMIKGTSSREYDIEQAYDSQISYTSMKNFPGYLGSGGTNRFGIWCYEWAGKNVLPNGFAKHYQSCDALCPPSEFAKRVFLESKIPESSMKVIPHGINVESYKKTTTLNLRTKKKFKIGVVLGQNHKRKNIPGLLTAYGKAFTNKDDVCLILKAKDKPVTTAFEVSLFGCIDNFKKAFPNHAEVKVYSEFIDDMSDFYRSVDATFTMTYCECFYYPGLESMAAGKLSIAPNWGGQVDFLNKNNALLIEGKETRADPTSMYWESKSSAIWFQPSMDDAVDKLKYAYNNFEKLNADIEADKEVVYNRFDWKNIAAQYLNLCT